MVHPFFRTILLLAWLLPGTMKPVVVRAEETGVHPHPVIAWPSDPFEVRVAFAQPLDEGVTRRVVGRLIPFEEDVSVIAQAKPRRPSRDVPQVAHRGTLRVAAARLEDGGRTLLLVTDPHPRAGTYSLHLIGIRGPGQPEPGESIDLVYGLGGVEVAWYDKAKGEGSGPAWSGWWPDLDPGIARKLTVGSVEHERSLAMLARPGRIVLDTLVVLPRGSYVLRFASDVAIGVTVAGEEAREVARPEGGRMVEHPVESTGEPIDLSVTLETGVGGKAAHFRASYRGAAEDARDVRLAHERLLVPWATTSQPLPVDPPSLPRELAGGDPARGETIFFGEQARCSSCHAIGKRGGVVGPELGHQFERPPAEVFRDVAEPGARINPDYVAYTVALKDGRILVGIVRSEGVDTIRVTDTDARSTVVRRFEIEEFRPSATSIMPVGLLGALGEGPFRDLLAFLTSPPGGGTRP